MAVFTAAFSTRVEYAHLLQTAFRNELDGVCFGLRRTALEHVGRRGCRVARNVPSGNLGAALETLVA